LPVATGRAIAEYLRHGRPQSRSRRLFLRHRAPVDAPVTTACVRCAVRLAYARCGLASISTDAHDRRDRAGLPTLPADSVGCRRLRS
jgi:hypothetical protein